MPRRTEAEGPVIVSRREWLKGVVLSEETEYTEVARICEGIWIVEFTMNNVAKRLYQVVWGEQSLAIPRVCYFETAQEVLNQHQRVIERILGTEIPLTAVQMLTIPGEMQRMGQFSERMVNLSRRFTNPLAQRSRAYFQKETELLQKELGPVTNRYKRVTKKHLAQAQAVGDNITEVQEVTDANLAILERMKECLGIARGTTVRYEKMLNQRNSWEDTIAAVFENLGRALEQVRQGKTENLSFVAGSRYSQFAQLARIPGPEYWARIKSLEVQKLGVFPDLIKEGKTEEAKRVLQGVILKLERVVANRKERKATEEVKAKDRSI